MDGTLVALSAFAQEKTHLDKFLSGAIVFLAPRSFVSLPSFRRLVSMVIDPATAVRVSNESYELALSKNNSVSSIRSVVVQPRRDLLVRTVILSLVFTLMPIHSSAQPPMAANRIDRIVSRTSNDIMKSKKTSTAPALIPSTLGEETETY